MTPGLLAMTVAIGDAVEGRVLAGGSFAGIRLAGGVFSRVDFTRADLRDADLREAYVGLGSTYRALGEYESAAQALAQVIGDVLG